MRQPADTLPSAVIILAGICCAVMAMTMPLMGDDLGYAYNYLTHYGSPADMPLIVSRHWLHVNSRMADMLNSVWLGMAPRWILASMCGVMTVLYLSFAIRCAQLTPAFSRMLLTALLLLTMPWWDSFFLFVCQFNYVWSSVLVLGVTGYITGLLHITGRWQRLMIPLGLLAGWMHEAAGLPAACGLGAWLLINRNFTSLSPTRRITVLTFCLGAALSVTSPASWSRAANVEPNDPMWLLMLKSDFYALALTLLIAWAAAFRRRMLYEAIRSPWTVFTTAALASMCFSAIGGIVGRSGWFAQTFALVALFSPGMPLTAACLRPSATVSRALTIIPAAVIALHLIEVTRWQLRANAETERSMELYRASADGAIYMDPLQRYDFPWWNLCKNKGVPDADDFYLNRTIDSCIGHGTKTFRVLPDTLSRLRGHTVTGPLTISGGTVSPTPPDHTSATGITCIDGTEHTVTPFSTADGTRLFYTAPRILDPGDR